MASENKRKVVLSDGTVFEVGDRQYAAITALRRSIDDVARATIHNLSLIETDSVGGFRQALYVFTSEGLDTVADALLHQSKTARHTAAAWDGNVRAEARSYMEH